VNVTWILPKATLGEDVKSDAPLTLECSHTDDTYTTVVQLKRTKRDFQRIDLVVG